MRDILSNMRTLHIDTGREMQGGQWQVLYLVERLKDATLLAPEQSPLLAEARKRRLDAKPLSRFLSELSRADLIHAHDSRAHSYAAFANLAKSSRPLVVSRRVGFPVKQSMVSRWKYLQATLFLAVSRFVAGKLRDAAAERGVIRVVYDGIPIPASPARPEPGRVVAVPNKSSGNSGHSRSFDEESLRRSAHGERLLICERNGGSWLRGHCGDGVGCSGGRKRASEDCRRWWSMNAPG